MTPIKPALTTISGTIRWIGVCVPFIEKMASFAMRLISQGTELAAPDIFFGGHWLQMAGIYARANAAQMIELHAGRDWSDEVFVSPSVGIHGFAFRNSKTPIAIQVAVTGRENAASPKPATGVRLRRNELPKPFKCCRIASRHLISLGSRCLGLREAGNFVAARFYFTPLFSQ